ncbi:MAG: chromosomal replication initiator DnaA [Proteobacteria bacterium]|nr:chromosomal replication initiator DnaA [Pseudomonadota bacterium]
MAVVFAIRPEEMRRSSRGEANVALARQVAMYLAHCVFQLPHSEVGRIFSRDRTTASHACGMVEDRRDDPIFDRTVANLEEIVRRLRAISMVCEEN